MEMGGPTLKVGHKGGGTECEVNIAYVRESIAPMLIPSSVWIDQATIARPMVPDKDRTAIERKVYPAEVS